LLFAQPCRFVAGVAALAQLPVEGLPEVAFAGRSNVGKSSLVNALTGRNTLARTSNTPGRTRQLNFFCLGERLLLVDLPGYGYAKVPRSLSEEWTRLLTRYLKGRSTLAQALVLVDSRHGLKDSDREMMADLDRAAVAYRIVLTKADKLKPAGLSRVEAEVQAALTRHPAAFPAVLSTSAETGAGIAALRAHVAALAAPAPLS
jgi:GTP-binding protein